MDARRTLVSGCLLAFAVSVAACEEQPTAPPIVVPSAPTVYVTNNTNSTVNVYPPAEAPAPPPAPPPPADEPPPPPLPPPAPPPIAHEAPRRASVGVLVCDQYIARIERCTAAMSDKFEATLDTMWENFKFAARTPDGRTSIAIGCRGGLKMLQCD